MQVVLTRERGRNVELIDHLEKLGVEAIEVPLLECVLRNVANDFEFGNDEPLWWVFSSARGVQALCEIVTWPKNVKIAVVGPATGKAVLKLGHEVHFESPVNSAMDLASLLPFEPSKNVIWWCGDLADSEPHQVLRERGFSVLVERVYSTKAAVLTENDLNVLKSAKCAVFMSASSIHFWNAAASLRDSKELHAVCIGPSTAKAASDLNIEQITQCYPHNMQGVKLALDGLI